MDTLTRMRAFLAVVDNEGFSSAARATNRSKALLSKYVRELEDELGTRLLNRTTRQFSPTDAGHDYYKRVAELLREFDELQDEIRDTSSTLSGRVKISSPATLANTSVGECFVAFAEKHPSLKLDIVMDDRFVDLVEEGFDLAIRITKLDDSSLIARKLAPFKMCIVGTPDLVKKHGMPTEPSDLANVPFVVDTNARRKNVLGFVSPDGSSHSVTVEGRMNVNSPDVVRRAVLAGVGFSICPYTTVADDLENGAMVEVLSDFMADDMGVYAIYPHRRYLPSKVRTLVDFMADWFKTHG